MNSIFFSRSVSIPGLPGFRRKGMIGQLTQVAKLGCMFPVYSTIYMIAPNSEMGKFMKKPFVKFICHSTSYATFLSMFIVQQKEVNTFSISLSLLLFQLIRRFGFCANPTHIWYSATRSCITTHRVFGIGIHWHTVAARNSRRLEKTWTWRNTRTNRILYHDFHHKYVAVYSFIF